MSSDPRGSKRRSRYQVVFVPFNDGHPHSHRIFGRRQGSCATRFGWRSTTPVCCLSQMMRGPRLRAAMSMARLSRDQGKRDEARDLLAPVHGWFTEGFQTLDLKEAKALLDELEHADERV
jgi:hypothetical protein